MSDSQETPTDGNAKLSTGLCDSKGTEIFVGDYVIRNVRINHDVHGQCCLFRIEQRGLTPVLSYVESQTGQKLPEGYTASVLCDAYDQKMFLFCLESRDLRPYDDVLLKVKDREVWRDEWEEGSVRCS